MDTPKKQCFKMLFEELTYVCFPVLLTHTHWDALTLTPFCRTNCGIKLPSVVWGCLGAKEMIWIDAAPKGQNYTKFTYSIFQVPKKNPKPASFFHKSLIQLAPPQTTMGLPASPSLNSRGSSKRRWLKNLDQRFRLTWGKPELGTRLYEWDGSTMARQIT